MEEAEEAPPDEGAALLARHLAGDTTAFPLLLGRFKAPVYGFFRRSVPPEVADDLFQETFLRVHRDARRFEPKRPFRVWLFTIAHNLLRSHYRKKAVRKVLVDWWMPPRDGEAGRPLDPPDKGPAVDDITATRESMRWLESALAALPERPRQALLLTQLEGLTLEQAADVMDAPVATIKTWVHRGRQALAAARRAHEGVDHD